jgi:hypothetical protein
VMTRLSRLHTWHCMKTSYRERQSAHSTGVGINSTTVLVRLSAISPAFESQPEQKVIVPKSQWFPEQAGSVSDH